MMKPSLWAQPLKGCSGGVTRGIVVMCTSLALIPGLKAVALRIPVLYSTNTYRTSHLSEIRSIKVTGNYRSSQWPEMSGSALQG